MTIDELAAAADALLAHDVGSDSGVHDDALRAEVAAAFRAEPEAISVCARRLYGAPPYGPEDVVAFGIWATALAREEAPARRRGRSGLTTSEPG